jgi:DegV family protein with EDD domain
MIVVTDSAADLTREEAESLGVLIAPLHIQFPEGGVSSEEITPDEFYNRLEAMAPNAPTTSQPSAGHFAEIYRKLAGLKQEILSIHISSGLSGTIEAARVGAQEVLHTLPHFPSIQLVDSLTLSGGERFQVLAAVMASKAGWGKEAILEHLRRLRESTEVVYTLETLSYLARGGRIGRVQALAGSLLKIKPVITVDKVDGKYTTLGKERTIARAMELIRDHLAGIYGTDTRLWVSVMHGRFAEQAQTLASLLEAKLNVSRLEILRISPVLGVHTGPGIVGAAVVPYEFIEKLGSDAQVPGDQSKSHR